MSKSIGLLAVFVFFVSPVLADDNTDNQPFSFIAIGDTPYSAEEEKTIKEEISLAIKEANPPFVVHYGDFKGGGESCSKKLFRKRRKLIHDLLPDRVFYTPGDNEWTDCDRSFLEVAVSELEMLNLIRQMFFRKPKNLPAEWAYTRQANFPENARWTLKDILFVTVHQVSTNNGRIDINKDDIELALSLVDARDQANRVWLEEAFSLALEQKAKAVVVITQADVTSPNGGGICTPQNRMNCDAFTTFRANLIRLARNFADWDQPRRPVLLLHGDTTPYCFDKYFGGQAAPNLWRLNAWGDFTTPADATVITVQPENTAEPFAAKTLLGNQLPAENCD